MSYEKQQELLRELGGIEIGIGPGQATNAALHNSSMLSIARPQGTNIFQLVIGTVLCFK